VKAEQTQLYDRILAALYGGVIGDGMGSPTEGKTYSQIERQFGWVDDFSTGGTDDTILRDILAKALIATDGRATLDDWAAHWLENWDAIFGAKENRFFISVLHTARKLRIQGDPRMAALGSVPCSSAAMGIAPVGMVNAANPRQAALQAYNLASLINVHDAGLSQDGAAAIAAGMAVAVTPGAAVDDVLEAASANLYRISGKPMIDAIDRALSVARHEDYKGFRKHIYDNADQFLQPKKMNALETVPITLGLLYLAEGDFRTVIPMAANFGRDADTMAAMGGALAGALGGMAKAPGDWITKAKGYAEEDQEALARGLTEAAIKKWRTENESHSRFEAAL
jgi:ADP-ribosylglycohydrolase